MAKLLIDNGVDVNVKNDEGDTALIKAINWNLLDATKLLLENGADVNAMNKAGWTALRYAENREHHKMAALLKKHGAYSDEFDYDEY